MNLALQKRHEQLERWRQNEAEVELIEKQRQEELQQRRQQRQAGSASQRSSLRSPTVQSISRTRSGGNSKSVPAPRTSSTFSETEDSSSCNTSSRKQHLSRLSKSASQSSPAFESTKVKFTHSTLFLNACAQGDLDEVRRMLADKLVDINVTTCDGLTGLHEAAICGNSELVELLLDEGADINCCDHEGWTPLHAAASLGQAKIVELLLRRQANATIVNCENFLAYDLARTDEVRALIGEHVKEYDIEQLRRQEELLIERDIERWLATGHYEERSHPVTRATVLHVLAAKGYLELMRRILSSAQLKSQIDLEARDSEGFTPLLAASFWNQNEMVELLIEHGANIFAQANSGYKISSIVSIAKRSLNLYSLPSDVDHWASTLSMVRKFCARLVSPPALSSEH